MQFSKPEKLHRAVTLLNSQDWKILAGGTDFYPSLGEKEVDFNVLDISGISSLRNIEKDTQGNWHIGALVTWSEVIAHDFPPAFEGLKLSAKEVGSVQIQNRATVVGNICNASPAADGVPPLLTLGAIVKIASVDGERELPLEEFILGNRQTNLKPNEMVVGLMIPAEQSLGRSAFLKLGARKYLVISISMLAARLAVGENGIIEDAKISVGSCSAVATRLPALEAMLVGKALSRDLVTDVADEHFASLSPIDDIRSTGAYRTLASKELAIRVLGSLAGNP